MTRGTNYINFVTYPSSGNSVVTEGFNCCFSGESSESTSMKRESSCSRKKALMRMVSKEATAKVMQVLMRLQNLLTDQWSNRLKVR